MTAKHAPATPLFVTGPLMAGTLKLGQIVKGCDGYRFLPATSAHKPSRKEWPTPDACIPAWARRMLRSLREDA